MINDKVQLINLKFKIV